MSRVHHALSGSAEDAAPSADPVALYDQQLLDAAGIARQPQPASRSWLALLATALLIAAACLHFLARGLTGATGDLPASALESPATLSPFTDPNGNLRAP